MHEHQKQKIKYELVAALGSDLGNIQVIFGSSGTGQITVFLSHTLLDLWKCTAWAYLPNVFLKDLKFEYWILSIAMTTHIFWEFVCEFLVLCNGKNAFGKKAKLISKCTVQLVLYKSYWNATMSHTFWLIIIFHVFSLIKAHVQPDMMCE